jgi:hypothetical protein
MGTLIAKVGFRLTAVDQCLSLADCFAAIADSDSAFLSDLTRSEAEFPPVCNQALDVEGGNTGDQPSRSVIHRFLKHHGWIGV